MIQKEVIEIQTVTTGTKISNFFGVDSPDFASFPIGYLILDFVGNPIKIVDNEFETLFTRLPDNTFQYDSTIKFITGRTAVQTFNYEITPVQQGIIRQKFININQQNYGINNVYWADFSDFSKNDLYANVALVKTYNTLNTLSIINSTEGQTVFMESLTGIVFGKIEAIQKISDENGNRIKIPLANIPVAVFNTSTEFPDISSVDDNGNRIVLNLKENSSQNQYFNDDTYTFAQDYLTSTETLKIVPDKYRYTALTNERGEFVIYDVPVGTQTFMVEVDLLKQGMTKDEVALNFFPYPTTSNPNIDNVPHFYFRQFSINVVPSWGDFQSGYTQLNISIPLDLRKWTTYVFPPAAFANEKLEKTVSVNSNLKFKIQARDMAGKDEATGELYPIKSLTLSKIQTDTDRDTGSQYMWFNEFAENRSRVEYSEFGCHVLKLPANLYDPDAYKTDENGIPTQNKGVWLSAYQLKCFVDTTICLRATGGYKDGNENFWSHFDVNYFSGSTASMPTGIGSFPYEKPWSINYPEKYKIPLKPVNERFAYGNDRTFPGIGTGPFIVEEPAYSDGDLIGLPVETSNGDFVGGFGIQNTNGTWFPNEIAYVATQDYMYKYESGVRWNETYANGFEPIWSQGGVGPYVAPYTQLAGMSSVNNGEKYQRLECGYGYFMKYIDWPRIYRVEWASDIYFGPDSAAFVPSGTYGTFKSLRSWKNNVFNINNQNLAFSFNQLTNNTFNTITDNKTNRNTIDIYRIVKSGLNNIIIPKNFIIKTYANLSFGGHADRLYSMNVTNSGSIDARLLNSFNVGTTITVQNPSGNTIVPHNFSFTLNPGGLFVVNSDISGQGNGLVSEVEFTGMNFPGNDSYNISTNQYEKCNYILGISVQGSVGGSIPTDTKHVDLPFSVNATVSPITWYINSSVGGGSNGYHRQGISTFGLNASNNDLESVHIDSSILT